MEKEKLVRLSGVLHESLVNGPGIRRVLFSQGCIHNCKNCFNPDTHPFEGGKLVDMDKLIIDIVNNPLLTGVTFSGGDPLEQADKFAYMAKKIKATGLNIWCYTGYTFEYILEHQSERNGWSDLINSIDVLVDGKYEDDKKDDYIKYRGSSNQRIIDVNYSLKSKTIKTINFDS